MAKKRKAIKVPTDEAARQAVDTIHGYIYQLHQTVLAWFNLGSDELLHMEFAEDIAVSDDGALDLIQVKRVSASVTMRSNAVAKLLTALWTFQHANPDRSITAALLTTSRISREKGLTFPGNAGGLQYWRIAAREGSDVEPIRSALLQLDLPPEMKEYVETASSPDLRDKIIRPVRWLDNSRPQDELDRDIEERLVKLGSRLGVAAQASMDALDSLVGYLVKSLRKPPDLRFVTATDLLTVFQKKTFVSVPPGILEAVTFPSMAAPITDIRAAVRDTSLIPLPPRAASRATTVARLTKLLITQGLLWLHGSSGLGKTTLALLIAKTQGVSWQFADLRDMPQSAVRSVLADIAGWLWKSRSRGLILDDFPADPDNMTIAALAAVARAASGADCVLIVTGTKVPPPTLRGRIDLSKDAIVDVPYLTEVEVGEIVSLAGGDAEKWARNVYLFAGGHPQLVDARVVGLSQRGWKLTEALTELIPIKGVPNDMEEERRLVRTRLLQNLDADSTEFSLRLSFLTGNFSREMAMVVASTPLPIRQAGMRFDLLLGPWIEQVGESRYRLSPLLRNSGVIAETNANMRNAVSNNVLKYLMTQRPFPADQLFQMFALAFQLNNKDGLRWFAGAILSSSLRQKKHEFKRIAELVSVVAMVDRGEKQPLIADDIRLSSMMRFAQLKIAVATEDFNRAAIIVNQALDENKLLADREKKKADAVIYSVVLLEGKIPIPAFRWMEMLKELKSLPIAEAVLSKPRISRGNPFGVPDKIAMDEMLFIGRASAVTSIDSLKELLQSLDRQSKAFRDRYLGAASRTRHSVNAIVASAWLAEVKRKEFKARAAALSLADLGRTISAQENADFAIELACAQAVMLDEYADDQEAALAVLSRAEHDHPSDYRLNRQRQRVFYRNKEHAKALAEFERFWKRMPRDRPIDRAYAMREAGNSAAELGDIERASVFFDEAWNASRNCGKAMEVMTAGLSADCALLSFDAGKTEEALVLMQRALVEADHLDSAAGLQESFLKRIHVAAILYMRGKALDWPNEQQKHVVGMCSEPAPQEWFRNQPQPQRNFVWYELAELEAAVSDRQVVLTELRRRTAGGGLLTMEILLAPNLLKAAVRNSDVERFVAELPVSLRAIQQSVAKLTTWRGSDIFNQPVGHLSPIAGEDWKDPDIESGARSAILSFMLFLAASDRGHLVEALRIKLSVRLELSVAAPLFVIVNDPVAEERELSVVIASMVGRMLRGDVMDASDIFRVVVYSLMLLENNILASIVAEPLLVMVNRVWSDILNDRTFSMRAPSTNGPLVLEALRKGDTAMQRLANMALATSAAVRQGLSSDLRARFTRIASAMPKKLWSEEAVGDPSDSGSAKK